MEGLKFVNYDDPLNRWKLDTVALIATKLQKYCMEKGLTNVVLHEVVDNRNDDPRNGRFDIQIRYIGESGYIIQQKLLYLQGEIIDGEEFHRRHDEFYPRKVVG